MKQVNLKVLDSSLKEVLGGDFSIRLPDKANTSSIIR